MSPTRATPSALVLRRVPWDEVPWEVLDELSDRVVFQTRPWLEFLAASQGGSPVIAEVRREERRIGWFSGMVVRRFGVPILGSSFPGWTTPYMGFNLETNEDRAGLLAPLAAFAFRELGCWHLEVSDRGFAPDAHVAGFERDAFRTLVSDLTQEEEALWAALDTDTRRRIRRAREKGVVVSEGHDAAFAEEYYAQLVEVFGKQSLRPTYDRGRVDALLHFNVPADQVLLLRARDSAGASLATGIYVHAGGHAEFWGNASWRAGLQLSPNELLHWEALMRLRARGVRTFDWGGMAKYKVKYGGSPVTVPWFRRSRFQGLAAARGLARSAVALRSRVLGRLDTWRRRPS